MRLGGGPVELITHGHLFCGDGGGADGFQRGHVRVGTVTARFECLGGIDVDPVACADFQRFVGVPPKRRVRGVGEVIGALPLPGEVAGGAMHTLPALTWKTWLRLALIPAGKDWRALRDVDFGSLRLVPRNHGGGPWGVVPWTAPVGTITAEGRPQNGPFAVADVRIDSEFTYSVYRVVRWTEPSKTVSGDGGVGSGGYTVADVRIDETRHNNVLRVVEWQDPTQAVTAGAGPTSGGQAVGDIRFTFKAEDAAFASGGHYGVLPWSEASGAVTSSAQHDNGRWSVADPRAPDLMPLDARPDPAPRILSLDDSWHRPLTTLEMAVLQGYDAEDLMLSPLGGGSHTSWREHIGNRVPPPAAQAMAEVMAEALILHRVGGSFTLDARPVWVRRLLATVDSAVTP